MQIFHNPRCTKSRETLALLQEQGNDPEVFLYLKEKITQKMLKELLKKLAIPAKDLIRKSEKLYKEEYNSKDYTNEEWIKIMVQNPKLIERPIVIHKDKAIIGRPPELVLTIL